MNAVRMNDIPLSADIFGEMTEKYPEDGRAWLGLAEIYYHNIGDLETAEAYYKSAIDASPPSARAFLSYCDLLLQLNRFVEMNAMVNKAMAIDGVYKSTGFYKSGLLKESQGHYDEAVEFFRNALLSSFSSEEIEMAEKSILRCQVKKKYS